jgi:hypothetical protein
MKETETIIDSEAFETNYSDAQGYHHRAKQFLREGQRSSLVFNVAAVALERYLVALCDLYGVSPRNHNYAWLIYELQNVMDIPAGLKKEIKSMDLIFGICSIDDYHHPDPDASDAARVLLLCTEVQKLFDQSLVSSVRLAS